jgi:hypothetical protein
MKTKKRMTTEKHNVSPISHNLVHSVRNTQRVLGFVIPSEPAPYVIRGPQAATRNLEPSSGGLSAPGAGAYSVVRDVRRQATATSRGAAPALANVGCSLTSMSSRLWSSSQTACAKQYVKAECSKAGLARTTGAGPMSELAGYFSFPENIVRS